MKLPKNLDFSNLTVKKIFDNSTKEYKKMLSLNDEGEWSSYINTMLSKGISVTYDASGDFFLVKPVAFKENNNKMQSKKNKLTLEDFNFLNEQSKSVNRYRFVGSNVQIGDLVDFGGFGELYVCRIEGSTFRVTDEETERTNPNARGWYIDSDLAQEIIQPYSDVESNKYLDEALSFSDEDYDYYDTDIDDLDYNTDKINRQNKFLKNKFSKKKKNKFEDEFEDEYLEDSFSLNENKELCNDKHLLYDDEEDEYDVLPGKDIDIESSHTDLISLSDDDVEISEPTTINSTSEISNPQALGQGITMQDIEALVKQIMSGSETKLPETNVVDSLANGEVSSVNQDAPATNDVLGSEFSENQNTVENIENRIEGDETYLEFLNGDETSETSGKEFEIYEEPVEQSLTESIEDDLDILPPSNYEDGDLDNTPLVNAPANGVINIGGSPIKIQITGWLITVPEVTELTEAVKKNKCKLRGIKSPNKKELFLYVESNKKIFKIKYEDKSRNQTSKPWSIKNTKFVSLNEAIIAIAKNKTSKISDKERFFNALVSKNKDISSRSISNLQESTIFEDYRNEKNTINYIPGWNVKSVGALDLKKGLNEVFSNIVQHSKDKNTLFKTKEGKYYVIKGNLGEASQKGTKRHLVDLEGKRDYGVGQVVGIYENNYKGLGQIMHKIQRTSIPLLVWKNK